MATFKALKKAAAQALGQREGAGGAFSPEDRLDQLLRQIETFAREDRLAERQRAMRVSADGMYVLKNVGSYASKIDGDRARAMIEGLRRK